MKSSHHHPLVVCKRTDAFDVSVTRPSKWGNPFSHIGSAPDAFRVNSAYEAVACYQRWQLRQPALMGALGELTGKVLGCACDRPPCHAEVIARRANNPFTVNAYAHHRVRD